MAKYAVIIMGGHDLYSLSFDLFVANIMQEDVHTLRQRSRSFCEFSVRLGPPRRVDYLAPPPVCHIRRMYPVKCLAQGHNKQACRLVLLTIPIFLNAKRGSCEYHVLKSFGMTRLGK